ncbi:MAG: L-ribulose-5-phosphate 3-epimerase [Oscillospiraceae bacterium]|nr:L-ribulose-5-phosphate 3-epimerase [Oscillospiraceae bacterium]
MEKEAIVTKTLHRPIGLYEKAMPDMPWGTRFQLMRKIGYDYFELSLDDLRVERLDWNPREIQALHTCASDNGLKMFSMNLSAHRHFPLGSSEARVERMANEIMKKAIDFAYESSIRVIQLAGYDVFTKEPSTPATKERFIKNLRCGVDYAAKAGVMLAIEPVDLNFITNCEHAMEYVNLIQSPWLQVYADFGNVTACGHDMIADLECAKNHLVAIHVKDGKDGDMRTVPLGEGEVDFIAAFRKLNEIEFNGPYIIEMWGEDDPNHEFHAQKALAFTKKHLDLANCL